MATSLNMSVSVSWCNRVDRQKSIFSGQRIEKMLEKSQHEKEREFIKIRKLGNLKYILKKLNFLNLKYQIFAQCLKYSFWEKDANTLSSIFTLYLQLV